MPQIIDEIPDLMAGGNGGGYHRRDGRRSADVAMPAGVYAVPSGDSKCKLPVAAVEITRANGGVTELLVDRIPNVSGLEYDVGQYVMLIKDGGVAVVTEQAVLDSDPVFVRFAAKGGNTQLGAFRKDSDDTGDTIAVTVVSTTDAVEFRLVLNGVDLGFTSASAQTAAAKATAWAAVINATAEFDAAAVGAVITITVIEPVGDPVVGDRSPANVLTLVENSGATAARLPRHFFEHDAATGIAFLKVKD